MRTSLRRGLLAASLATFLSGVATVSTAFTPIDRPINTQTALGACFVDQKLDTDMENGFVTVTYGQHGLYTSGGSAWNLGTSINEPDLNVTELAMCLSTTVDNITNFADTGADAATFAAQTYMGFSFTLTEAAGGLDAGPHEYSVGTAIAAGPTITLGELTLLSDGTYTSAITLSDAAGDDTVFDETDLTLTNATATLSGSGTSFTATLTPITDGVVALDVATGAFTDAAGNDNTAATQVSATYDGTAPTVELGALALQTNGTYTSAITLSEAAGDNTVFALDDLTLTNATAILSGSGTSFTATLTPSDDGLVALDVAAGTFTDAAGNDNTAATQVSATFDTTAPTVALSGPSGIVTGAFDVSVEFSEDVTGLTEGEITVEGGSITDLSGSDADYTITIEPVLGETVTVTVIADAAQDDAGNGNIVSNIYTIQAGSPASEFEENKDEILTVVTDEALRGIRATVSSNVRMTNAARERFIRNQQQAATDSPVLSFAATPLDITGSAEMSDGILNTQGMFFGQTGSNEGGQTRLFFGDFGIQRDADGSVSAQLNGKLAWERQISATAMYGYYMGAELGRATLEGAFAGEQDSFGASVGAYFVAEVQPNLYVDGFASLGLGRNSLELDNGTLNVASDYTTTTGTVGASLTGVVEGDGYEFWPQLQLTYGQTHIGMMSFTGEAYSLVDDTLSLDAGSVSIASGVFTAEFKVPLDGRDVSDSRALFTFAPRLICERIMTTNTTNDCGGGAEIGIVSRSSDGLSNLNFNIRRDRVGSTTSTGLGLNFERVF